MAQVSATKMSFHKNAFSVNNIKQEEQKVSCINEKQQKQHYYTEIKAFVIEKKSNFKHFYISICYFKYGMTKLVLKKKSFLRYKSK